MGHLHLPADWHLTQWLIEKASTVSNHNVWMVIWGMLGYAILHGTEAVGLWLEQTWAEWFTLSSGAIYIPLEVKSMLGGFTAFNVGAFIVSLIITSYLGAVLYQKRKARRQRLDRAT